MSAASPQSPLEKFFRWLALLPHRLRRAWRLGSAYYHGGTAQRIVTYLIFLVLLVIFLAFFAGGVMSWLMEVAGPIFEKPKPTPTPLFTATPEPTQGPTPIPVPNLPPAALDGPLRKLFETDVVRHYLAVGMSIWVAVRIATIYFGDIHRIERYRSAERLFRHMLLAFAYGQLELEQGGMKTPQPGAGRLLRLLRVGVPVRLHIAKDTCAVIEGIFAEPYVVGPTRHGRGNLLRGFSRLRQAVDLRDHAVILDVDGHTSDGLALAGRGIALTFSVYRGGRAATEAQAYPYDEQAILNLVYRTWLGDDFEPAMVADLSSELRQFIASHPLEYFAHYSVQADPGQVAQHQASNPLQIFVTRFNEQAQQRGIELRWDGGGAWVIPPQVDLGKQADAWQLEMENLLRREGGAEARKGAQAANLPGLIRSLPVQVAQEAGQANLTAYRKMRALARAYRDKLQEAAQIYQARGQAVPEDLNDVIEYLTQLINRQA